MRSGALFTIGPFALVATLAVGLALGGYLASPRPTGGVGSNGATPIRTAVAISATPEATGSPSSTPASTKVPRSNDAADMLRVQNELRAAVGAPAVRTDDRVTAAAQHHAEYLARAGTIGHEESPGSAGFTGVTVRDRLAAQGYPHAMSSEGGAASEPRTEDVPVLGDLPEHRLRLDHPHAAVAGWGHAEGRAHTAT